MLRVPTQIIPCHTAGVDSSHPDSCRRQTSEGSRLGCEMSKLCSTPEQSPTRSWLSIGTGDIHVGPGRLMCHRILPVVELTATRPPSATVTYRMPLYRAGVPRIPCWAP